MWSFCWEYLFYLFSVSEIVKKWALSERTVRNYYDKSRIKSAFLKGKTWNIPENAMNPNRIDNKKFTFNYLIGRKRDAS